MAVPPPVAAQRPDDDAGDAVTAESPPAVPAPGPTMRHAARGPADGASRPGRDDAAVLGALTNALHWLRDAVTGTRFPLALPGAEAARRKAVELAGQLDDYLLPRLANLDAPLLVAVSGPTGAGKSTLVNSVVGAPVSAAGMLPAATRPPVLVCSAADVPWFSERHLLPGLARAGQARHSAEAAPIEVVAAPTLPPGLALLDTPAADSVVAGNQTLAAQLTSAADLLIFVTTASRYADASWWTLLRAAWERGAALAVVLDRVPLRTAVDVTGHLAEMLTAEQLGATPLIVIPASGLDAHGLLSEDAVATLYDWLFAVAGDAERRTAVVHRTLDGAIAAAAADALRLAGAADAHTEAARALRDEASAAYVDATALVADGVASGALLRGEVLARWEELVATGLLPRALQARRGSLRGRLTGSLAGRALPGKEFQAALADGLTALILAAATDAAEQAAAAWRLHPAGAALLAGARAEAAARDVAAGAAPVPEVGSPAPELEREVKTLVARWRADVTTMVNTAAGDQPPARHAAYVAATDLLVMIAVVISSPVQATAVSPTSRRLLAKIVADAGLVSLAARARDTLLERVDGLLFGEQDRFSGLLAAERVSSDAASRIRDAVYDVAHCREAAMLTDGTHPDPLLLPDPADGEAEAGTEENDPESVPDGDLAAAAADEAEPAEAEATAEGVGSADAGAEQRLVVETAPEPEPAAPSEGEPAVDPGPDDAARDGRASTERALEDRGDDDGDAADDGTTRDATAGESGEDQR